MSLSFQQGILIIFPLVIMPYLLRVLGLSGFGVFTLIQTGILYFDLLITFGFSLTATQHIAKATGDIANTQKIIAAVYYIKSLLFAASCIAMLICLLFIPYLQQNILLIFFSAIYLLGNLLFPDWYFSGIQQMKNCTLITLISKFISLVLIIVLVRQQNDISKAFFALAVGNLLAGCTGVILLRNKIKFRFTLIDKKFIKELFKESGYVFTSIILVPLYSSVNIFILQAFTNPLVVGSYSVAQKVFSAISMLASVINNTFFPYFSKLYTVSVSTYRKTLYSVLLLIGGVFLILSVIQFFGAKLIIELLVGRNTGEDISYAIKILQIMSIALFFSPFVAFFFQQMIIQQQQKELIRNILFAIVVNLVSAIILSYYFSGVGMAINAILVYIFICYINGNAVNKKIKQPAT